LGGNSFIDEIVYIDLLPSNWTRPSLYSLFIPTLKIHRNAHPLPIIDLRRTLM
jgi:hypothetical protein